MGNEFRTSYTDATLHNNDENPTLGATEGIGWDSKQPVVHESPPRLADNHSP